nr:MAK10-like protein [Tanacetum cinerariifolium]
MGDENPIRTLGDYSKPSHEGYRNTIELPEGSNVVLLRSDTIRRTIDQSAGGKLRDLNPKESWEILEDLALYDNKSWNDPKDFAKLVKAITLPQDVPSTSDRCLIELENQVQCLMEVHLTSTRPTQVNKITTQCEICSGPHDTQYYMENTEQAFVEYASSRTDEAGGDTIKNPKPGTHPFLSARSYPVIDPRCSSYPSTSINAIKAHFNDTIIEPQQTKEPEPTLNDEFKNLHLNLSVLEVLSHALIYNAILDKYVKSLELGKNRSAFVQGETLAKIGDPGLFTQPCRLGDSEPFDTLDPETPLLVGRGFLATANAVIDCRMAKIAVGEGITRSIFNVKGIDLGEEEAPYWTIIRKRESYKTRPSTDGIGAKPPYYARKDFIDCHLLGEWEFSRDAELNPFKDTLVFMRMVEFLEAIPINHKCNMWESDDLYKKPIDWSKPPKYRDGAWHAKIWLIDPNGEEFTKTIKSIPTTRKLFERESPRETVEMASRLTSDDVTTTPVTWSHQPWRLDRIKEIIIKEYLAMKDKKMAKQSMDSSLEKLWYLADEDDELVKLINITFEQWLDLKFIDHKKVDKEIMERVVATWLIQSYRKQFKEYMKIKRRLEKEEEESSEDSWSNYLPNDEGINNGNDAIQANQEWFDDHKLMKDDDHDIGDLDDYVISQDAPYYVMKRKKDSKKGRTNYLGYLTRNHQRPDLKCSRP